MGFLRACRRDAGRALTIRSYATPFCRRWKMPVVCAPRPAGEPAHVLLEDEGAG